MNIERAVITAAGKGQRDLPLQTLVDRDGVTRSALAILLREVLDAGIRKVAIVVRPGDEAAYREAAGDHAELLHFLPQAEPKGYGHALFLAKAFTCGEAFLHLVGDHLSVSDGPQSCARQLVEVARAQSCAVSAVQATRETKLSLYGAVGGLKVSGAEGLYRVECVREKPTPTQAEQELVVPGLRAAHMESSTPHSALDTPHSYDYDALQRRVGTTDPRTGRSFVTYHPTTGLVIKHTDAAGNETLFAHDATGRQIAVTDPEGNTTHTAYTLRGQVAATWGATYPVVYEYDSQGRMIHLHTLRDPENEIVFNPTVDDNGVLDSTSISQLLTSVTDVTSWLYEDATGLLLEKLYADNKGPAYTYTPDGRLDTRTWAREALDENEDPIPLTTTYQYDPDTLELIQITYSDDTPAVTNTYDRLGRLVSTTDAFGTKTYTYDPATLQPHTETWDGLVETTLTRAYDNQGRPTGFSLGAAHTVTHTYTDTGRFHAVTVSNALEPSPHDPITATYTYTPNSPLISGYTLGGLTRTVIYENNRNLIDTVANTWDTTLISQFDYTNDKAGRRTDREDSGTAFASTQNNTFSYNDRNEVTSADMRNGTSTYSFDQIGNRVEVQTPDEPNPVAYLTNALNQYTSIGASAPPPPISPSFDADGNLTDDGEGTTFEWNAENRMVRVEKGSLVMLNTYDGQGRRVRKHVFDNGNPVEDHRFFYDGWNLIYEIDVLAADPEPTYYVWGLDLSQSHQGAGGVGGLLLVSRDSNHWAPTYDANGNISEYINLANGNIDAHLEYDAFGRIIASTGTAPSNFGFSTKYEDTETGYLYYGFRFYDPQTGRWPNRDPIEEEGGYNLYGFVANNPIYSVDYLGLSLLDNLSNWIKNNAPDEGCYTRTFNLDAYLNFGLASMPRMPTFVGHGLVRRSLQRALRFVNRVNLKLRAQICADTSDCCLTASGALTVEGNFSNVGIIKFGPIAEGGLSFSTCDNSTEFFFCAGVKADISLNAIVAGGQGAAAVKGCISSTKGFYVTAVFSGSIARKGIFYDETYGVNKSFCLYGNCGDPLINF